MDARSTERLSLGAQSDNDRRVASSILVTMAAASVTGIAGGTLLVLSGPAGVATTLILLSLSVVCFGFVGVQMVQVWHLVSLRRWLPVVVLDAALLAAVMTLLFGGWPLLALAAIIRIVTCLV